MSAVGTGDALEPRELGTLIVVVGKARNLPNKSRFGKQDPFCTIKLQEEKQKTKSIKRGGQHPEWDEELRFRVKEDLDEVLARSDSKSDVSLASSTSQPATPAKDGAQGVTTAAALANKSRKGPIGKSAGKKLVVACYADDAKEPDLIGECSVPIDDVLKKGEVDEWYEFTYKDKYSGEVYLELTFYSNEAPPVKRNPHIQRYGQASLVGGLSASQSLSSRPSIASLSTSSSVSGMNLYIPPYAQPPPREPSPAPPQPGFAGSGVAPSNSFAKLGLPQVGLPQSHSHHRNQSLPSLHGQPGYLPSLSSMASTSTLAPIPDALDALTRPMSSMSISSSFSQRPLPPPSPAPPPQVQPQTQAPYPPSHRHSLGEAPWATHLPQTQPPPGVSAPSRPLSSNDTASLNQYQWDQLRVNAATPMARPSSAYQPPQPAYNSGPYTAVDPRAPSPIPPALTPAHAPPHKQHANSFSGFAGQPHPSTYLNTAPTPPPPSHSAPPVNGYAGPSSSFPSLSQEMDPYRTATPMNPYRTSTPQPDHYAGTQTPRPQDYNQGYQPPGQYDHQNQPVQSPPPMPQQQYDNGYPGQIPGGFPASPSMSNQWNHPGPPRRQSTPTASHSQPNASGYVPWHQQTQPAQASSSAYHAPTPPPVPDYNRPAPGPPVPSRSSVGYYPSDELYAIQQQLQQAPTHTAPPTQAPWQQQAQHYQPPPPDPYRQASPAPPPAQYGHDQQYHHQPSTSAPHQQYHTDPHQTPYPPETPPRAPAGWQSVAPQSSYAPTPPPQAQQYPAPPAQYQTQPPFPPPRSPSPAPPPRASDAWSILSNQQQQQQQQQHPPPGPSQSYDPNQRVPSPAPPAPAPAPAPAPGIKHDWRSYMQTLNSGPGRSPSPQPPHPQHQPPQGQQQDWYTPPPSLPSSIQPPSGWNSGAHVTQDGHQWR